MSEATSVLGMGSVTGFEIRARFGEGTPLAQRKLNNPDSVGVAYMTVQGVPAPAREKVAEWLAPKRAARLERTLAMAAARQPDPHRPGPGALRSRRRDMVGISQYANGGGITERHLLAAMASALIRGFGRGPALVQGLDSDGRRGPRVPRARPVRRGQPAPHVRPAGRPEGQLPGSHLHPAHRRAAQRGRGRRFRRLGRRDRHLRLPGRRVRLADGRQEG